MQGIMYTIIYSLVHQIGIFYIVYFFKYALKPWSSLITICIFEYETVIGSVSLLQLLIGYENGTVVFWDLRSKRADLRAYYDEVSNFH